jgi:hypothetical protein
VLAEFHHAALAHVPLALRTKTWGENSVGKANAAQEEEEEEEEEADEGAALCAC